MELEFQQIDLRNEHLRKRNPVLERQLLASLDGIGQRVPVVVVAEPGHFVLLDGFKRVRALQRLRRDTVLATVWDLNEAEGLLLERLMRAAQPEDPLEQGWLLRDLRDRFRMSMDELARRFDRTPSWVSRRLALVQELPEPVQDQVRAGRIAPHTAMKIVSFRQGCLTSSGPPDTFHVRGQDGSRRGRPRKEIHGKRRHSEPERPCATWGQAMAGTRPAAGSSKASTPQGSPSLLQDS